MGQPIESFISGKRLEVARLQDTVMDVIYDKVQPDAVLYGGTAVWRCYNGGRFSEDIGIYTDRAFFKRFAGALADYGLSIVWRDPEFETHAKVSDGTNEVMVESGVSDTEGTIVQYEKVDGRLMTISSMSPAELFVRKLEAYSGRRYIRDIYDLFILTNKLDKDDLYIRSKLKAFLEELERPADERILKSLVYRGRTNLGFDEMVGYLRRWIA